jgi:hypothetical protein
MLDSMVVHILTNLPLIPVAWYGQQLPGIGTTGITPTSCHLGFAPRTPQGTPRTTSHDWRVPFIAAEGGSWGTDSEA